MERVVQKKEYLLREIRRKIVSGEYAHGEKLPVEAEFAVQLNVARGTLRKTLNVLENEGLLLRIRSKGTFVNYPMPSGKKKILVLQKDFAQEDPSYQSNYELPSMQDTAKELGLTLELCSLSLISNQNPEEAAAALQRNSGLLGAVIFDGRYTGREPYVQALQQSGLPVVMVGCHREDWRATGFAGIRTDSGKAWHDGLQALIAGGHKRIAIFYRDLMLGFYANPEETEKKLRALRIYDPELLCRCELDYGEIFRELKRVMNLANPPTAIMCSSDFIAIMAERAAREMNIKIPCELAVMGYSGVPDCKFVTPALSTVDRHFDVMGRKAVELLSRADSWFGKEDMPDIIIPHDVVIRESSDFKITEGEKT